MTVIAPIDCLHSVQQRKKIGRVSTYGKEAYGKHHYGLSVLEAGIYQVRRTPTGKKIVREKFYTPTDTWSQAKQDNRDKFAAAVAAWQGLTSEQKVVYRTLAIGKDLSGYNLYLREAMLS